MTMDMNMWMVMYAPTQRLTVSAMIPYFRKEMNMVDVDGNHFVMRGNGIGDLELRPEYLILQTADKRHQLILNGGVGVPTGSIDEEMGGFRVDYCMQPGSGTVSLLPGLTYLGQTGTWSWGADFKAALRLGRNDHDYRFGNRYESRAWVTRQLTNWLSISTGLNGAIWDTIHGADPLLDPMIGTDHGPEPARWQTLGCIIWPDILSDDAMLPVRTLLLCNANLSKRSRTIIEGRVPIIQSLDDPQLQNSWTINTGWQWMY